MHSILVFVIVAVVAASAPWLARPAMAVEIGVTSAAVPQARGTPPDVDARVLQVGLDMFANERVETDARGKAQLLFVDGSALTVGPGSDVVLDEFVYDPDAKTGKIAFSATKGLFRLVGGRISKRTPVEIRTPTVTIGVRGGIALVQIGATVTATFLFGQEMTVSGAGVTRSVQRPGFQVATAVDGTPGDPVRTPESDLADNLDALEGTDGDPAAAGVAVSDDDIAASQLAELGSANSPGSVSPTARASAPDLGNVSTRAEDATELTVASQQRTTSGGLTLSGFTGRSKRGTSTAIGTNDRTASDNLALSSISISGGTFKVTTSQGDFNLFFPSAAGSFTVGGGNQPSSSPYGAVNGTVTLTSDSQFVFYELTGASRIIAFAGQPTPASAFPTSGVTAYDLGFDFGLGGSAVPFLSTGGGGDVSAGQDPTAFVYWGTASAGAKPAFLAPTIAISGQGTSQKYGASVILGSIETDAGGKRFLSGNMRGSGRPSTNVRVHLFEGRAGTSDAGDGSDFFGSTSPDYFVLEAIEVDGNDTVIVSGGIEERGIDEDVNLVTTEIFPNIVAERRAVSGQGISRLTRTIKGFTGGLIESYATTTGPFDAVRKFHTLASPAPASLNTSISTDAGNNRLSATFKIESPLSGGITEATLPLGSSANAVLSAFIDDDTFGAVEGPVSLGTVNSITLADLDAGLATNDQAVFSNVLPSGVTICTCSFLQWGFWGAEFSHSGGQRHQIGLAQWVAGEIPSAAQIPSTGIATYAGTMIASVANGLSTGTPDIYTAFGSVSLSFSFEPGSYTVSGSITNLDSGTFSLSGSGGASADYTLSVSGSRPGFPSLTGVGHGAFFGTGTPPANTGGDVTVSDGTVPNYQFGGIYIAEKQ